MSVCWSGSCNDTSARGAVSHCMVKANIAQRETMARKNIARNRCSAVSDNRLIIIPPSRKPPAAPGTERRLSATSTTATLVSPFTMGIIIYYSLLCLFSIPLVSFNCTFVTNNGQYLVYKRMNSRLTGMQTGPFKDQGQDRSFRYHD